MVRASPLQSTALLALGCVASCSLQLPVTSAGRPPLAVTPATAQAKALVDQMTTAEKASLLNGIKSAAYGNSHNGYYVGNIPGVKRLGVPSINMQDASQGFRTIDPSQYGQVTSWPCGLAVAAAWDVELMQRWAVALGKEFRAKGANMILGPSLNVHRVARNGRNAEYMSGESAYLGSKMVPAYVRGVQSQKVIANIKHYILNNQETNRNGIDSRVGERAMHEVYMRPFRAGALEGAASAMCSYNLVNGTHSCGSESIMNQMLKTDLNWTGFITSDWGAVHATGYQDAGLDMDQPGTDGYFAPAHITKDTATLDDMATRVVGALAAVGALNDSVCTPPDCDHYLYSANATSAAHAELAREIAASGAALLKNENGVLPLKSNLKVQVVGDACDAPYDLESLSGWNIGNYYVMGGSGRVINPATTSIIAGIKQRAAASNVTVVTKGGGACGAYCASTGCSWTEEYSCPWASKAGSKGRAANDGSTGYECCCGARSSKNVPCGGSGSSNATVAIDEDVDLVITCGATWSSEGADRKSLKVDQDAAIQKLVAGAKVPVVVLLTSPGALVTSSFEAGAAAMVSMHLAGQATGLAWADVLFGDVNPSGRLPVTFPKSEGDTVQPCGGSTCEYTEGLAVGYRGLWDKPVSFPFGHGLSYTSFKYTLVGTSSVAGQATSCAARACVQVSIKNTGVSAGAEVAQLYLTYPDSAGEPSPVLAGFNKTQVLAPGASTTITFPLEAIDVSIWDVRRHSFAVVSGTFTVQVGASSRDIRLKTSIKI